MNKKKIMLVVVIFLMIFIIISSRNQENLKKLANNFGITQTLLKFETGVELSFQNTFQTVAESLFLPAKDAIAHQVQTKPSKESLSITNQSNKIYNIQHMLLNPISLNIDLDSNDPQILIIHTHGTESYMPLPNDTYIETSDKRTDDMDYNISAVADILHNTLNDNGINAVKSNTLHDFPQFSGSYTRSLDTIDEYLVKYPSIKMVIDVHRDAIISSKDEHLKTHAIIDGEDSAQIMFVIGTNAGGLEHPNWNDNLNNAVNLQNFINKTYPNLMKNINLRDSRFNQHATSGSILIEIGSSGNTLDEAKVAISAFSTQLVDYLKMQ